MVWMEGWRDASARQGMPKITSEPQEARKRQRIPYSFQREYCSIDTLISNFWPLDCETINFCCFKPHSLWCFVMAALGD